MNVLFICSRNRWRSRTAEDIFQNFDGIDVRSAGTSENARIKVNEKSLDWADLIFVMERRHKQLLMRNFQKLLERKELVVLDIPDEYQYMDAELVDMLKLAVASYW